MTASNVAPTPVPFTVTINQVVVQSKLVRVMATSQAAADLAALGSLSGIGAYSGTEGSGVVIDRGGDWIIAKAETSYSTVPG